MAGSKPDFGVYVSRKGNDDKSFYTRIGSAWKVAKDGISIQLDALPVREMNEGQVKTKCVLLASCA